MKPSASHSTEPERPVRPLTGARIETKANAVADLTANVRPLTGARIETIG